MNGSTGRRIITTFYCGYFRVSQKSYSARGIPISLVDWFDAALLLSLISFARINCNVKFVKLNIFHHSGYHHFFYSLLFWEVFTKGNNFQQLPFPSLSTIVSRLSFHFLKGYVKKKIKVLMYWYTFLKA